jgi:hypothetical protein
MKLILQEPFIQALIKGAGKPSKAKLLELGLNDVTKVLWP